MEWILTITSSITVVLLFMVLGQRSSINVFRNELRKQKEDYVIDNYNTSYSYGWNGLQRFTRDELLIYLKAELDNIKDSMEFNKKLNEDVEKQKALLNELIDDYYSQKDK